MEEIGGNEGTAPGSTSRRQALKAGVAAGVGLVAWTGPTISSLGGTPAYAQAGSVEIVSIGGGCSNLVSSSDPFVYQLHGLGGEYSIIGPDGTTLVGTNSVVCDDSAVYKFTFPTGSTCSVTVLVADKPTPCKEGGPYKYYMEHMTILYDSANGYNYVEFVLPCTNNMGDSPLSTNDQYNVYAECY